MSEKDDVFDYVMNSPENTNPNVLHSLLDNIPEEDYTKYWNDAIAYNEALAQKTMSFTLSEEELAEYNSILDATGTGVIGYIEIENIGVNLPIYHGTAESVLQVGIGHLEGTSFLQELQVLMQYFQDTEDCRPPSFFPILIK